MGRGDGALVRIGQMKSLTARSNDVCATNVDNWVLISRSNDLRKRLNSLALFDSLDVVSVAFWD